MSIYEERLLEEKYKAAQNTYDDRAEASRILAERESSSRPSKASSRAGSSRRVVIGTSPSTGEVLVRDTRTGKLEWKQASPDQLREETSRLSGPSASVAYREYKPPGAERPTYEDRAEASRLIRERSGRDRPSYEDRAEASRILAAREGAPHVIGPSERGRALERLAPYKAEDGGYYLTEAIREVPLSVLRDAGFTDKDIRAAVRAIEQQETYDMSLSPFKVEGGYDLVEAYRAGLSRKFLERAGFDKDVVRTVADTVDATRLLNDVRDRVVERIKSSSGLWTTLPPSKCHSCRGGGCVPKEDYERLPKHLREELDRLGVDKFSEKYTGYSTKETAKELGISLIPIYGTYHAYKSGAPTWEVALSGAADLLWVIPPVRMMAGAARAGTKLGAKAAAGAARQIALAEVRAPIDTVLHPKQAIKVLLDPVETVVRPSKVPLESLSISFHTVKLPTSASKFPGLPRTTWSADEVMKARDELMRLAMIEGKGPKARIGAQEVKLQRSVLEKIGPVAVSSTEDVRPFMKGATVGVSSGQGAGRELYLAPNLVERFTLATSTGKTTKGGVRGGLIIRDPEILDALRSSRKLYQGTAEAEMVLPPGTKLPPPSQTIITRDLQGNKLTLLVFGRKFSEGELAGLKLFGPQETLKQIFSSRYTVSKAKDLGKLTDELADVRRQVAAAEAKVRKFGRSSSEEAQKARSELNELLKRESRLADEVRRAGETPLRYAAVDTSGGRAVTALRDLLETSADLEERAKRTGVYQEDGPRPDPRRPLPNEPDPIRPKLREGRYAERIGGRVTRSLPGEKRAPGRKREEEDRRDREGREPRKNRPRRPRMFLDAASRRRPPSRKTPPGEPHHLDKTYKPRRFPKSRLPIVATPGIPGPPVPGKPPKVAGAARDHKRKRQGTGEIAWKQGLYWIKLKPPFNAERPHDVEYSLDPFPGAKITDGSPEETFFTRGERVPAVVRYQMGEFDVMVRPRARDPLEYIEGGSGAKSARKSTTRSRSARRKRRGRVLF